MSDSSPQNDPFQSDPLANDPLSNGMDDGTGDPNDDRTYLMDEPPVQVDEDAVREHASEEEAENDASA